MASTIDRACGLRFIGIRGSVPASPAAYAGRKQARQCERMTVMARDMSADTELAELRQECQRLEAQVKAQGWELRLLRFDGAL